ncbi:Hypothetical predicted protein [Pelobates cultripes]|uniref:Uncharacterized protein n=1 Tax=Pelobates cultripes TaxID=61616 RepID=A0AAD1WRB7_PELCU|nr:Hypothetical predicted protein [Pelobates cultripes]
MLTECEALLRRSSHETRPGHVPASKADIQNMLKEIKAFFVADIALVREDIGGRLAVLEDSKRQRNLQVRGVPEDITNNDVPHYLHRMLSSMLSPSKAKVMPLDYNYWVPKSSKALARIPKDLVLCFQSLQSKQLIQASMKAAPTYHFEGSDLETTILWRKSLQPVTKQLRVEDIKYR